jgi:hypothetical protein
VPAGQGLPRKTTAAKENTACETLTVYEEPAEMTPVMDVFGATPTPVM